MLVRRKEREVRKAKPPRLPDADSAQTFDRRDFLRASGVGATALGALGLGLGQVRLAAQDAKPTAPVSAVELKKTVCPFCSVGCSIWAEVNKGVWVGQEPVFESPINMGTHCAKGAATRELAHGERRLKYPTKLVNGQWQRISWDQAIAELGDKLPPIIVNSATMRVVDGMHRLAAAALNGCQEISVRFYDGTDDETFVVAVTAIPSWV